MCIWDILAEWLHLIFNENQNMKVKEIIRYKHITTVKNMNRNKLHFYILVSGHTCFKDKQTTNNWFLMFKKKKNLFTMSLITYKYDLHQLGFFNADWRNQMAERIWLKMTKSFMQKKNNPRFNFLVLDIYALILIKYQIFRF